MYFTEQEFEKLISSIKNTESSWLQSSSGLILRNSNYEWITHITQIQYEQLFDALISMDYLEVVLKLGDNRNINLELDIVSLGIYLGFHESSLAKLKNCNVNICNKVCIFIDEWIRFYVSVETDSAKINKNHVLIACRGNNLPFLIYFKKKNPEFNFCEPIMYHGDSIEYMRNAVMCGFTDVAKFLKQNKVKLNEIKYPLLAAKFGHIEFLKWLDSENVEFKVRSTAICSDEDMVEKAFTGNSINLIKWLYQSKGFNLTRIFNSDDRSTSHSYIRYLCYLNNTDMFVFMIKHGSPIVGNTIQTFTINAQLYKFLSDLFSNTPPTKHSPLNKDILIHFKEFLKYNFYHLLLAKGADNIHLISLLLKEGKADNILTLYNILAEDEEFLFILRLHQLLAKLPFDQSSQNEILDLVKSKPSLLNYWNGDGQTALHIACIHNLPELATGLIDLGADILSEDSDFRTPIYYASPSLIIELDRSYPEKIAMLDREANEEYTQILKNLYPFLQKESWNTLFLNSEVGLRISQFLNRACHARHYNVIDSNVVKKDLYYLAKFMKKRQPEPLHGASSCIDVRPKL